MPNPLTSHDSAITTNAASQPAPPRELSAEELANCLGEVCYTLPTHAGALQLYITELNQQIVVLKSALAAVRGVK